MAFKSIHNQNPFVIPALLFGLLIFIRSRLTDRSIDRTSRLRYWFDRLTKPYQPVNHTNGHAVHQLPSQPFLLRFLINPLTGHLIVSLFVVALLLVPIFEGYFKVFECSVSQHYYEATISQSLKQMECFDRWHIDYWLDYATLLNQLRGQTINHWDHDADFSIVHPDYSLTKLAPFERASTGYVPSLDDSNQSVDQLLNQFEQCGLTVSYDATRHLIQTFNPAWRKGPHVDIWLWIPTRDADGSIKLFTADHTVRFTPRPAEMIFPLSTQATNATGKPTYWLDRPASIPAKPHHISSAEFRVYGGSYLLNQAFRGDCFHNFFNLRWFF